MLYKDVGYLRKEIQTLDSRNRPMLSYEETKVFCNIKSTGYNEFFQAQAVGYKADIKVELRCLNIDGVTHFRIGDNVYKVIRYYKYVDKVELTLNNVVIDNEVESGND